MEQEALFCFYEMESHGLYHLIKNRLLITIYEDVGISNPHLLSSICVHIDKMDELYKKANGAWRLILGNIILSACRGKKSRIADQFVCTVAAKMCNGWRVDFSEHDFVYDMHTVKGRKMGRGAEHFYDEASTIVESDETTDYWQEEIDESNIAESKGFNVLDDYSKSDEYLGLLNGDLFAKQ